MPGSADLIRPMLATAGTVDEVSALSDGWGFEFKWDGVRAVTYLDHGMVRAFTRNDKDVSATYPELQSLAERLPDGRTVFDGEIVSLDRAGRPDFGRLQSRMHVSHPADDLLKRVPVCFFVFDLLRTDGRSMLQTSYAGRRARLEELDLPAAARIDVPPSFVDVAALDLLSVAEEKGLEGIVAKRLDSTYQPGRRSRSWIKVPLVKTQEVVIGGWKSGEGRRAGTIGSLLLGAYDGRGLAYIGHVGTGFTQAMLSDLYDRLTSRKRRDSPFADTVPRDQARGAHWVDPDLVGEVEYRQWTHDGRLRHSSWRGLRPDKDPSDVTLPRPVRPSARS